MTQLEQLAAHKPASGLSGEGPAQVKARILGQYTDELRRPPRGSPSPAAAAPPGAS